MPFDRHTKASGSLPNLVLGSLNIFYKNNPLLLDWFFLRKKWDLANNFMIVQQVCRRGGVDGEKKTLVIFRVLPPYNLCECRQNTQSLLINKNMNIYFGYIIIFERISKMDYLVLIPLPFLQDSWSCGLMSFVGLFLFFCFLHNSWPYSFKYFFCTIISVFLLFLRL